MTTARQNLTGDQIIVLDAVSVGNGSYESSDSIENIVEKYLDCLIGGSVRVATVVADGTFSILAYANWSGSTTPQYSGGLDGVSGPITWGTTPSTSSVEGFNQLRILGTVSVDTTDDDNDIEFGPFSLASAYGGVVPRDWGIVLLNETGVALHGTQTNTKFRYTGVLYDSN